MVCYNHSSFNIFCLLIWRYVFLVHSGALVVRAFDAERAVQLRWCSSKNLFWESVRGCAIWSHRAFFQDLPSFCRYFEPLQKTVVLLVHFKYLISNKIQKGRFQKSLTSTYLRYGSKCGPHGVKSLCYPFSPISKHPSRVVVDRQDTQHTPLSYLGLRFAFSVRFVEGVLQFPSAVLHTGASRRRPWRVCGIVAVKCVSIILARQHFFVRIRETRFCQRTFKWSCITVFI